MNGGLSEIRSVHTYVQKDFILVVSTVTCNSEIPINDPPKTNKASLPDFQKISKINIVDGVSNFDPKIITKENDCYYTTYLYFKILIDPFVLGQLILECRDSTIFYATYFPICVTFLLQSVPGRGGHA